MKPQAAGAKQRSYTEEYKREAAELVRSTGRTATAVAAEFGLHPTLLCHGERLARTSSRLPRQIAGALASRPQPA